MNNKKKALSFDIGGTKTIYAVIDEYGNFITEKTKIPTPDSAGQILEMFKNISCEHADNIDAVTISTAGAVNIDNTKVCSSTPNLPSGYPDLNFKEITDKKVFVENDANCAVWAEHACGAAKGCKNVLMITLGTGIGGGAISNGKLIRGYTGAALEVGSVKIFADRRQKCTCGRYDCWESYASGTGLKNIAAAMAKTEEEFKNSLFKDNSEFSTFDIINGVDAGDKFSLKVFNQWQDYIFTGLVGLVNIFNPEIVVISGGMGKFADAVQLEEKINQESVVTPVKIKHARTGNDAGMIGAAILGLRESGL